MGAVGNLEKLKYDDVCRHLNHSQFGRAANQREAGEVDPRPTITLNRCCYEDSF